MIKTTDIVVGDKMTQHLKCGTIAIVGRPNVGKSTLLNRIIGQKIAITSSKPQTTRHRLLGIQTEQSVQRIFVDTPGIHQKASNRMNKIMNRSALSVLQDVDVIVWLVVAGEWTSEDASVAKALQASHLPIILVVNQIDRFKNKEKLLPYLNQLNQLHLNQQVELISAQTGDGITHLLASIDQYLPFSDCFHFSATQTTDQSDSFMMCELIREKLFRLLGDELPYGLSVQIEMIEQTEKVKKVHAIIWIEKANHKPIVIGKKGEMLKQVGQQARIEIEKLLGEKIFLGLWVKVKSQWTNNLNHLRQLGLEDS